MTSPRLTALLVILLPLALAAKCGDEDAAKFNLTGGEVTDTTSYQGIDYPLTSDNYRKWTVATAALDSMGIDQSVRLRARSVTDDGVDSVVKSLEARPDARAAIEGADLSVRDYVLTTIALAQSWDAVNTPGLRVAGLPERNIEFLRLQGANDTAAARVRPRAVFLDDSDSDSDSRSSVDSDSESDSDSEGRGRGKDKNRGKGKGKGKNKG